MTLAYTKRLGLQTQETNVGAQKIIGLLLEIFGIVIASFQIINKLSRICFFSKTFLLAVTNIKVVLGMSFFLFSNINIYFNKRELT